jgi:hypothetical protein
LLDSGRIWRARSIRIHNTGLQENSAGRLKSSAAREKLSASGEILKKADKNIRTLVINILKIDKILAFKKKLNRK